MCVAAWMMTPACSSSNDGASSEDAELVEATAATPTSFPTGYFQSISLSPDRTTYLAVAAAGLEKCTLATGTCAAVSVTGLANGDAPNRVWINPVDALRVFLTTSNGSVIHFYTATDGGIAFTAVPLPSGLSYGPPIFSPSAPSTIAVQIQATESSAGGLSVTTDSGAHWSDVQLPQTPIVDISGFAFDAATAHAKVEPDGILIVQLPTRSTRLMPKSTM